MGWFDFLSKTNKKQEPLSAGNLLDKVEVKPGVTIARAFADNWEALETTKLPYISIEATPVQTMRLEQSKFGHYPKIPVGFDYPKDVAGNYMYPLAQINFKEVPPFPGYPTEGLLQFYISVHDELFGLDFENNQSQQNFRIHYFEEAQVEKHQSDFSFLQETMTNDASPVYKPHALKYSLADAYLGVGDVRYENSGRLLVEQITDRYPAIKEELEESIYDDFSNSGHKIGGYAYFTQEDPRLYNDATKDFLLLLQIDTDKEIMWGDAGVANFFIHPDDLAKKDFSKVIYNWDCS